MKKRKQGRCFSISAIRQSSEPRAIEEEPEDLVVYVRRVEKEVLPIIKEMHLAPESAQFLLAQQTGSLSLVIPVSPPRAT